MASILDAERLTLPETAEQLGVHVSTVWRWALEGINGRQLPTLRIGGRRYVLRAELERFVQAGCESSDAAERQEGGHAE